MVNRTLNVLMAFLLFFSVGLQYNDPDPIPWMIFYGAAGLLAAVAALLPARYPWPLPAIVGLVGLVWALTIAPDFIGRVNVLQMFANFEMKDSLVEEARECFGLLLASVWMGYLVLARWFGRRHAAPVEAKAGT